MSETLQSLLRHLVSKGIGNDYVPEKTSRKPWLLESLASIDNAPTRKTLESWLSGGGFTASTVERLCDGIVAHVRSGERKNDDARELDEEEVLVLDQIRRFARGAYEAHEAEYRTHAIAEPNKPKQEGEVTASEIKSASVQLDQSQPPEISPTSVSATSSNASASDDKTSSSNVRLWLFLAIVLGALFLTVAVALLNSSWNLTPKNTAPFIEPIDSDLPRTVEVTSPETEELQTNPVKFTAPQPWLALENADRPVDVAVLQDYSIVVASQAWDEEAELFRAHLLSFSPDGTKSWDVKHEARASAWPEALYAGANNDFVVVGSLSDDDADFDEEGAWIASFNANGALRWQKSIGDENYRFNDVVVRDDGTIFSVGTVSFEEEHPVSNIVRRDGFIAVLDSDGSILQETRLSLEEDLSLSAVGTREGGGILVSGTVREREDDPVEVISIDGDNGDTPYFAWLTPELAEEASLTLAKQFDASVNRLIGYPDGGHISVGQTFSAPRVDVGWLVRFSSGGEVIWDQKLGVGSASILYDATVSESGDVTAAGEDYNRSRQHWDMWLVQTNPDGDLNWSRTFGNVAVSEGLDAVSSFGPSLIVGVGERSDNILTDTNQLRVSIFSEYGDSMEEWSALRRACSRTQYVISKTEALHLQTALKVRGYDIQIDGVWGSKSQEELDRFKASVGCD